MREKLFFGEAPFTAPFAPVAYRSNKRNWFEKISCELRVGDAKMKALLAPYSKLSECDDIDLLLKVRDELIAHKDDLKYSSYTDWYITFLQCYIAMVVCIRDHGIDNALEYRYEVSDRNNRISWKKVEKLL